MIALGEMKDEYDDLAESEQFGVVVRNNIHKTENCNIVKSKYSHFPADFNITHNHHSRENRCTGT